ncbi:YkvA family protein [Trichothermofontia sp.]
MSFSIPSVYQWYRGLIRNPKYRGWVILATIAYLVFPVDISPDIFPIVGQIDDVIIATLLVTEVSQLAVDWVKGRMGPQPQVATQPVGVAATHPGPTVDVEVSPLP